MRRPRSLLYWRGQAKGDGTAARLGRGRVFGRCESERGPGVRAARSAFWGRRGANPWLSDREVEWDQ